MLLYAGYAISDGIVFWLPVYVQMRGRFHYGTKEEGHVS